MGYKHRFINHPLHIYEKHGDGSRLLFDKHNLVAGHVVAQLVEALCYKPEGRGFNS